MKKNKKEQERRRRQQLAAMRKSPGKYDHNQQIPGAVIEQVIADAQKDGQP